MVKLHIPELGSDGEQFVKSFRTLLKRQAQLFQAQRDHVHELLHGNHHYASGAFREGLLRDFLVSVLPRSVSVDSGFIYGFDVKPNSKQIDILVWDSGRHAAVFRTGEFVIVAPEAVIAAISVKTTITKTDLVDALENLHSVAALDLAYRSKFAEVGQLPPIVKAVVGYTGPANPETALAAIKAWSEDHFATDATMADVAADALATLNPVHPSEHELHVLDRLFPKLVVAIGENQCSLFRGLGPPEDRLAQGTYGPNELRRIPYMYAQGANLVTPLERLAYHVVRATYIALGIGGGSLVNAWGEYHPVYGVRFGDTDEIDEAKSASLIDPDRMAAVGPRGPFANNHE